MWTEGAPLRRRRRIDAAMYKLQKELNNSGFSFDYINGRLEWRVRYRPYPYHHEDTRYIDTRIDNSIPEEFLVEYIRDFAFLAKKKLEIE